MDNDLITPQSDKDRISINLRKRSQGRTIGLVVLISGMILLLLGLVILWGKGHSTVTIISFPVVIAGMVIFQNSRQ